ncbi:hypothetical protein [Almyronema epifaneia]|uniref:Serine/threonine protein kinase n=1 Tax=Almyronema epifaneia S1 TaxID=2991925 RepID=A0ABW6ICZ4_9CYAN
MSDSEHSNSQSSTVTIVVAIIGLVSAVGTTLLTNWDKVFPTTLESAESTTAIQQVEAAPNPPTPTPGRQNPPADPQPLPNETSPLPPRPQRQN